MSTTTDVDDVTLDDDPATWLVTPPRTIRLRPLPLVLTVALVAAAGILGGVSLEKHHGTATTTAGAAARTTRSAGAFTPPTGGGFGGAGASGTSGTVTAASGSSLTVTTSAGKTLHVAIGASTLVTRTGDGAAGAISAGDTVEVVGKTTGSTLDATSVTATASGVRGAGAGSATFPTP